MLDNHAEEEGKCNFPNCNPRLLFNEEDVYLHQIKPLLQKAKEIATKHGLPILMATCYRVDKDSGSVSIKVDAGGVGREDWAPPSFCVARKMITSEAEGTFPKNGGTVIIGPEGMGVGPGPMGGIGGLIDHILGKIAEKVGQEGEEDKSDE